MEKDGDENRSVQQYRLLDLPGIIGPGILCITLEELILIFFMEAPRSTISRKIPRLR